MKYSCFEVENNFLKYKDMRTRLLSGCLNDNKPMISVVIPTYKRPNLLRKAISSVLNQNYLENYEIIVIDNDVEYNTETEKLIFSFNDEKILYYKNEVNLGQVGNWNKGIMLANGDWVVLLHDDDYLEQEFLLKVTNCLRNNDKIEGLFTIPKFLYLDSNNNIMDKDHGKFIETMNMIKNRMLSLSQNHKTKYKGTISELKIRDYYFDCGVFAPTGGVYKKRNIIELGGFAEEAFPLSDWDFHLRYINKFNMYVLFEELLVMSIGVNDSLKKNIRIEFIEKGYKIRKAMRGQLSTLFFGNWWIHVACWRHALDFQKLKNNDIDKVPLKKIYRIKLFKYIYFLIVFTYSRHLHYFVPYFETKIIYNERK